MGGLKSKVITALANETQTVQHELLTLWEGRANTWLMEAKKYVSTTTYQNNNQENTERSILEATNGFRKDKNNNIKLDKHGQPIPAPVLGDSALSIMKAYKKMSSTSQAITGEALMKRGYRILNEIGEKVRGEEIIYQVTLAKKGGSIAGGEEVYTWNMSMDEFLDLAVTAPGQTQTELKLVAGSTLFRQLSMKEENYSSADEYKKYKNFNINRQLNFDRSRIERWSPEKIQRYSDFAEEARLLNKGQWENVNNGNILEAFLRKELDGGSTYSAMDQTMKSPAAFFEAGDIYNMQEKGANASVTNLSSLITYMNMTINILHGAQYSKSTAFKSKAAGHLPNFDKKLEEFQDSVLKELTSMFTHG